MFFSERAKDISLSTELSPSSTRSDLVAASASGSRVVGSRPFFFTVLIIELMKAC